MPELLKKKKQINIHNACIMSTGTSITSHVLIHIQNNTHVHHINCIHKNVVNFQCQFTSLVSLVEYVQLHAIGIH